MGKEVVHESKFMTVWYHNDTKIVHHKFHTFTHGEDLREGLIKGLEIIKKNGAAKWLPDDRENPILKKEDMEWTASVWRPAMINAGWKCWAIVMPEKTAGKMAMNKIIKEYADTGVTVQIFPDPDAALSWLESQ